METQLLVALLLLPPLIGFLVNGLRFKSKDYKTAGMIGCCTSGLSFVASLVLLIRLIGLEDGSRSLKAYFFNWIHVGNFQANASFLIDQISIIMLLVITGVGTLIHIFSIGYMSHDDRPAKYFSYLNLFLFNMLLLVTGDNLLIMFVGWEGVGLCSYLLIGFWFSDKEKAAAGMKAFITNRIGDAGFLLGIFLLFITFGSVEFEGIFAVLPRVEELSWSGPITISCLFLFLGACGKSAQIPLYVWLPDAMAGPTPVSALIHAATMVTAGIYMIVRLSHLFVLAPNAMFVIACIGGLTALFAATIGMTQWDIKKVLAYSTVSQLGYMFLAVGVGAFMPALFHLMTHAFFKALMFLGSGSVIHSMDGEQDIRKMGGLKKFMPITHITFLAGWIAIIGIPPFAGFFSKDEILWQTFITKGYGPYLWLIGVAAAGCTAFYMTRLVVLTFWGQSRVPSGTNPHESPASMTVPLIVLAVLSVIGGFIGIPHVISEILPFHPPHVLENWLEPVLAVVPKTGESLLEWVLMGISVGLAGLSAVIAVDFYLLNPERPAFIARKLGKFYDLVYNKYFIDEFYFGKIINPLVKMSKGLWIYVDVNFIDKTTYVISDVVKNAGNGVRAVQSGNLQVYALYILIGLVMTITFVLVG